MENQVLNKFFNKLFRVTARHKAFRFLILGHVTAYTHTEGGHGLIASSIFLCSSILALSLCESSSRNQMWRGTENSVLPLGQEFLHLQVLKRWFWVHDTCRLDISAGLCRHTSSQLIGAFPVLATSWTTEGFTVAGEIFYVGEMLLVQVQVKSAFRNGGASGEPMWRRCQVWFLLLPILHGGSGWGRDCTLEY